MKTILSYDLPIQNIVRVFLPVDAEVLSVGVISNRLNIFAMSENTINSAESSMELRTFCVVRLGADYGGEGKFIGTAIINQHSIYHVFEESK